MLPLTLTKEIYDGFFLENGNNFARNYIKKNNISRHSCAPNEQATGYGRDSDEKSNNNNNNINTSKPKARLLLVDDEPDIVQIFKLALQQDARFLVDAFTNPKEALRSFKSNAESYNLMITDIRMPELSGIQLTKKVREINPNVKVVLTTAFEIKENELSDTFTSSEHIDGFIQKPIGIDDLNNKILNIMRVSKQEDDDDEVHSAQ